MDKQEYIEFLEKITKRAEKVISIAEEHIAHIFANGHYGELISFAANWMQFSAINIVLLHKQRPDASYVCRYGIWKKLARDQGLPEDHMILPPEEKSRGNVLLYPHTVVQVDNPEVRYLTYRGVLTFDKSQVNGITAPAGINLNTDAINLKTEKFIQILREGFGDELVFMPVVDSNFNSGYCNTMLTDNIIWYRSGNEGLEFHKELIKEIIRFMAGPYTDAIERELVHLSAYYLVMRYFGVREMEPGFASARILAERDGKELMQILHRIISLAQNIIYRTYVGYYSAGEKGTDDESKSVIRGIGL